MLIVFHLFVGHSSLPLSEISINVCWSFLIGLFFGIKFLELIVYLMCQFLIQCKISTILCYSTDYYFSMSVVSFAVQAVVFIHHNPICLLLDVCCLFGVMPFPCPEVFFLVSSSSFIPYGGIFKSLMHFELNFLVSWERQYLFLLFCMWIFSFPNTHMVSLSTITQMEKCGFSSWTFTLLYWYMFCFNANAMLL